MNDAATLSSQPVLIEVKERGENDQLTGEVLKHWIHPLSFEDIGKLQEWLDRQFPDPIQQAQESIERAVERGKPFTVAQEQFLYKSAQELAAKAKVKVGMLEATQLLLSAEGSIQIILLSIKKGDPNFTDDDAKKLFRSLDPATLIRVQRASQANLIVDDPKAESLVALRTLNPNGGMMSRRQRRAKKV
jgi:hypothetical protein